MADMVERFPGNPLLRPSDLSPSGPGLRVEGVLNPAAFTFLGRTWLLARVAEGAEPEAACVVVPLIDAGGVHLLRIPRNDPDLDLSDPRLVIHRGRTYLSTLSHLRLFVEEAPERFGQAPGHPPLFGQGSLETFGIEDPRVTEIDGEYLITHTAVSAAGFGVALRRTRDWCTFRIDGTILPPPNKDCAVFPGRISGTWWCLHRPSARQPGGNDIWIARSPDLVHWGAHACLARTRPGCWDEARIGAGGPPIPTGRGWLVVYHGADRHHRYCHGALLLDHNNPARLIARSREPFMEPLAPCERSGFFNDVVFSNGHIVQDDTLTLFYGGADAVVCGARIPIRRVLDSLEEESAGQEPRHS